MSDSKASALINVNNYIYDVVMQFNNTLMPKADQVITQYHLSTTAPDVSTLSTADKGQLLVDLCVFLAAMGESLHDKTSENMLIEGGFTGFTDAITHVTDYYSAGTSNNIKNTLSLINQTYALIQQLVDNASLSALVTKLIAIRQQIATVALQLNRM
jgi:hypothetical protein